MRPAAAFIHDFVAVDLPLDRAVAGLKQVINDDGFTDLVTRAWIAERRRFTPAAARYVPAGAAAGPVSTAGEPHMPSSIPGSGSDVTSMSEAPPIEPPIEVFVGPMRTRFEAALLPIAWRRRPSDATHNGTHVANTSISEAIVPEIDADLEFSAFGPSLTHLHLYGRTPLPPPAEGESLAESMASGRASTASQLATAHVRTFLSQLAARLAVLTR